MIILTGYDWEAHFDKGYKFKGVDVGLFNLEGSFQLSIQEAVGVENYVAWKVGLCLIRSRSKPIVLNCLIMQVDFMDEIYNIKWSSDGKFDPKPRNKITKGKECKIFIEGE